MGAMSFLTQSPVSFLLMVCMIYIWSNVYVGNISQGDWSFGLTTCIEKQEWFRVFTSPFVHRLPIHLSLNVLVLWTAVSRIEEVYGSFFVLRYTLFLAFLEAICTWFLVYTSTSIIQHREWYIQILCSCFRRENLSILWNRLRSINSASLREYMAHLAARVRGHLSNSSDDSENQEAESLLGHESVVHDQYSDQHRQQQALGPHPFEIGHVMGFSGIALAWLVFSVVQVGSGSSSSNWHDLEPITSARDLSMTKVLLESIAQSSESDGTPPDGLQAAKVALATNDYHILGFINLDPSLAPMLFLLIVWVIAPGTAHQVRQGDGLSSWSRSYVTASLSVQNVRYTLQSLCAFMLGSFLGSGWLSYLPNLYWTLCFVFNCALLSLHAYLSVQPEMMRPLEAAAGEGTGTDDNRQQFNSRNSWNTNILGIDFNRVDVCEGSVVPVNQWADTEEIELNDESVALMESGQTAQSSSSAGRVNNRLRGS